MPNNLDAKPAIRKVTCQRCGRTPTAASNNQLNHGYCLVCWDKLGVKKAEAEMRAIGRLHAIADGTWYDADERDTDARGTTQARITNLQ